MGPNDRIEWGRVLTGAWDVDGYTTNVAYLDDAVTLTTAGTNAYADGLATATTATDYVEYVDTTEWPIRWNRNREINFTADRVQWFGEQDWTVDNDRKYVWKIFSDDVTFVEESEEKELEESEELNSFLDELVVQDG